MQENDFERQIKNEMDGFIVKPSRSIWEKIELQIPRQSRRRRSIAFIFVFTGLMVCGYFFYNKWNGAFIKLNENMFSKTDVAVRNKNLNNINDKQEIENLASLLSISADTFKRKEKIVSRNSVKSDIIKHTVAISIKNSGSAVTDPSFIIDKNNNVQPSLVDLVLNTALVQVFAKPKPQTQMSIAEDTENERPKIDTSSYLIASTDRVVEQVDAIKIVLLKDTMPAAKAPKKQPAKINIVKKWQIGFSGALGWSDVSESFLDLNADKRASSDFEGLPTGNLDQQNGLSISKQVKPKSAFSFGLAFKKQLGAKGSLIAGLQYAKYRTQIETGAIKDSAAIFTYNNSANAPTTQLSNFYTSGSGNTYTNRYYLLQIPLIYEHRINRDKNIIVNWNAGLSLSRLLTSNAIVFDRGNRAFYNNNELFKKTQLSMLAGVNLQFALSKKVDVNIGPQLAYSFNNLLRSNSYGDQHFINYGLKANLFLKR